MRHWLTSLRRQVRKVMRAGYRVLEAAGMLWQLLEPFHRTFRSYLVVLAMYEAWQIGMSYSASALMLVYKHATSPWWWAALLAGYFVYDMVATVLDNRLDDVVVTKLDNPTFSYVRALALKKLLELDPAWYERQNSGVIVARVTQGMEKIRLLVSMVCWEFTPTTIQTLLSLVPLLYFSPLAAVVTVSVFGVFIWVTVIAFRVTQKLRRKRHNQYEEVYRQFDEYAESHRTLVLFGQEDRLIREHGQLLEETAALSNEEAWVWIYRYHRIRQCLLTFTKVVVRALWIVQLLSGTLDLPTFVFLNVILDRLLISFWRFARMFEHFTEGSEPIKRFCRLLQAEPILGNGHRTELPTGSLTLTLKDTFFSYSGRYENGKGTIRGLNLTLTDGMVVALVGKSGAGKSTLQKLLMREWDPQEGDVLLNGVPVREWDLRVYRQLFAIVPQGDGVHLLDATLYDNIVLAKPDATEEEVFEAARLAQLHDWILTQRKSYQSRVGDKGIKLSGGQKQRVALARAFLANRPVLVLDEATSAVDTDTESSIQTSLRAAGKGKLSVVIAHRLSTVRHADLIVVLGNGTIIEQGTHDELMALGGTYAKLAQPQELIELT